MTTVASVSVPEASPPMRAITRLLAGIRRRTRAWIAVEALASVVIVATGSAWLSFVVDRSIEPPSWARGCWLAATLVVVAWLVATRLIVRLAVPLDDAALALVVERSHPEFGDALSTAVAYGGDVHHEGETVDARLLADTMAAAAALTPRVRGGAVFRRRRLTMLAAAAVGSVALTAWCGMESPKEAEVWGRRMLWLEDVAWPRRVQLVARGFTDGTMIVARGSDVDLEVEASVTGGAMPDVVELRTKSTGDWRTERMGSRGGVTSTGQVFGHRLKGVSEDLVLDIRGGDARLRGLVIEVADRPMLVGLGIRMTLPVYLGGQERTLPASRLVAVPRGSVVVLSGTATKPLRSASVALRPTVAPNEGSIPLDTIIDTAATPPTVTATTPPIDVDSSVLVRLEDDDGLENTEPVVMTLAATPDEPPRLTLRLDGISTAVTPKAQVPIVGTITDDHGLMAAAARIVSGDTVVEQVLEDVSAGATQVECLPERPFVVSLAEAGLLPGRTVELRMTARDGCPLDGGPHEASSDAWVLDVVEPDVLQAMLEAREVLLRRRLEAAIDDLAKGRDAVAAGDGDPGDARRRGGDAAARAAGETTEIAAEVRGIHRELANNGLLTADLDARLLGQITTPLALVATDPLAEAARRSRGEGDDSAERSAVVAAFDDALARMRAVLARMLELESVNEVIERLRGVIRTQEQIREETLRRQRQRGREALESP